MERQENFREPEPTEKMSEETIELGVDIKRNILERKEALEKLREDPKKIKGEIQKLVEEVGQVQDKSQGSLEVIDPKVKEEKIKQYQDRHVPTHLRDKKENGALLPHVLDFFIGNRYEKKGEENLPEKGPFLVVCNHSGGETGPLLGTLKDYDAHVATGKRLNWDRSPFRKWLLNKMRAISVEESLDNLSGEEKDELVARVPRGAKKGYQSVVKREKEGKRPLNTQFIRESVALLSRGDVVAVFPEGLFLHDGQKTLRRGYGGIELIAKHYKDLTGEDLTILPMAIYQGENNGKKTINTGEQFNIDDNKTDASSADWCMGHIAKLLPEDQRGYYKDASENL